MAAMKSDWREEGQREELRPVMKGVGLALNIAGVASCIGALTFGRLETFWLILCIVITIISFGVYIVFPCYFSINGTAGKRNNGKAKLVPIEFAVDFPACAIGLCSLQEFEIINWEQVLFFPVICATLFTFLAYLVSKEIKENKSRLFVFFMLSVLSFAGVMLQINHLANEEKILKEAIVTDLDEHIGRSTSWYCDVISDEFEMRLPIGMKNYFNLSVGDKVLVYTGTGALGIEYAYFAGTIN